MLAVAIFRGKTRGLVRFSQEGLWLSTINKTLPWHSVGPTLIYTTNVSGGKTDDVVFIVKGLRDYLSDADLISRIYLWVMKSNLDLATDTVIDYGLIALI